MAESLLRQELGPRQGLRIDGRSPNELRRINCKIGAYSQPDGSAYLEQGNTTVLAAVYGPHQAIRENALENEVFINCHFRMAFYSSGETMNHPRSKAQEMTVNLKQVLGAAISVEVYPRSQIDVYVEVLQDDGGAFCAGVNAATLALIDAGISLRAYTCACTASIPKHLDRVHGPVVPMLDVTRAEEAADNIVVTVASLPRVGNITLLELSHKLHMDNFDCILKCAMQGCKVIEEFLYQAVQDYYAENTSQ